MKQITTPAQRGIQSDRLLALVLMAFSAIVFLYARDWQMEAGLYPRAIAVIIFALSSFMLIKPKEKKRKTPGSMFKEAIANKETFFVVVLTVVFIMVIEPVGFFVALPIYIVLTQLLLGSRDWKNIALSAVSTTVFVYLVFVVMLSIRIPVAFWLN